MKHLLLSCALMLTSVVHAQSLKLVVCEADLNGEKLTMVDDGIKLGFLKGVVDIQAGSRGNNLPKVFFSNQEIRFVDNQESCVVSAQSQKGSFSMNIACEGEGAGTITNINLPSIGVTGAEIAVQCSAIEYAPGQSQPTRPQAPTQPTQPTGPSEPDLNV